MLLHAELSTRSLDSARRRWACFQDSQCLVKLRAGVEQMRRTGGCLPSWYAVFILCVGEFAVEHRQLGAVCTGQYDERRSVRAHRLGRRVWTVRRRAGPTK